MADVYDTIDKEAEKGHYGYSVNWNELVRLMDVKIDCFKRLTKLAEDIKAYDKLVDEQRKFC